MSELYKINIFNLGNNKGYSTLDVIKSYESVNNLKIPYEMKGIRLGDASILVADSSKAQIKLHWSPIYELDDMCRDSWNWKVNNPNGYDS